MNLIQLGKFGNNEILYELIVSPISYSKYNMYYTKKKINLFINLKNY